MYLLLRPCRALKLYILTLTINGIFGGGFLCKNRKPLSFFCFIRDLIDISTDGIALLCVSECLLYPPSAPHPPIPTPPLIDAICTITAIEENYFKTRCIQIACGISFEIIAI